MAGTLSPYRLRKARELNNICTVFNSLSWQFMVGNIITLFALRMGASSTYIGTLNAALYVSFFFMPLGKTLTNRYTMIKIFSTAWIFRSIGMIPVLFVPAAFNSGHRNIALLLVLLGVALFHIIRGIGMVANNPILSFLATGPDRGSYLTQIQIISSAVGMFSGFIIAMLLGRDPPLFLYALIVGAGISCGIYSGFMMRKIPEPGTEKNEEGKKLVRIIREALAEPSLRLFIFILLLVALVSGVSRIFLVVYCREVFRQSDGMVSLYSVFGGLGVLLVGLLIKFLVDRIGAKPLFSVCVIISLISMIPIIFFPMSLRENYSTVTLFLAFLFFLMNFGWLGSEGIMQTYFMGLVPPESMMDMGILYFFGFGLAGAGGSFLGGAFLDIATAISGSAIVSYRILYFILVAATVFILFLMRKLVPLGALPFRESLEVMFSYRDLRAITLLDKLEKTSDSGKEKAIIEALYDKPSKLALKGLLARVKSPRLSVRMDSLRAIEAMESLTDEAKLALMDDLIQNPFTTAYISARTLGSHGVFEAIPLLRELASSKDYMLAGEATIALAKLGDHAFRPQIEQIIIKAKNPRLKIMGVEAFGIYGSPDSLSVLLDIIRVADPPPYLRDTVVLAMASILDIQNKFYPLLMRLQKDESQAGTLSLDEAESAYENYVSVHGRKRGKKDSLIAVSGHQARLFQPAVSDFVLNSNGSRFSQWILELPDDLVHTIVQTILSEAVLDDELMSHPRLKLLVVHWAAHELRLWTNKLKAELKKSAGGEPRFTTPE